MRRSRVVSRAGRGAAHVNAVQHRAAGRPAQSRSLPHRLLVDLAVHDDHHDARDPEGHERAYYRVRPVYHESAHLRSQKPEGPQSSADRVKALQLKFSVPRILDRPRSETRIKEHATLAEFLNI